MVAETRHQRKPRRRGAAVMFTAVSGTVMVGFVALSVDVGMLYNARAELQRSADASALAGANKLVEQKARNVPLATAINDARAEASAFGALNTIQRSSPTVDENSGNATDGDVVVGYLGNPSNLSEALSMQDLAQANSVEVRVRRNQIRNGPIPLWFARIWGFEGANMQAQAAATFRDGVVGFKVTEKTGNAQLLPFALHVNYWHSLLDGSHTTGDLYSYDPDTQAVSSGADGVLELNLYPGAGGTQLPPGNFGTVDIGSANNSTADICRQILYGVNASDLSYFGGELKLGTDGTVLLNGDTGLSAGMKDELAAIKGQPRCIPLFDQVSGNGNNSMFRVVGFAGVRIMYVKLTGAMNQKSVIIQPAYVVDDSTITGSCPNAYCGTMVYQPVRLSR